MTLRITGTIIPGEGNAVRNHSVLIPLLTAEFPQIASSSKFGTINVRLDQPLDKSRADTWTRRIIWQPVQRVERRVETFGLIKIKFECPVDGQEHDCWILLPEGSSITYSSDQVEIIATTFIENVRYGAKCVIVIDHMPAAAAPPSFGVLFGMSFH